MEQRRSRHRWTRRRPTVRTPRASRQPTRQAVCAHRHRPIRTVQRRALPPSNIRVGAEVSSSREPRRSMEQRPSRRRSTWRRASVPTLRASPRSVRLAAYASWQRPIRTPQRRAPSPSSARAGVAVSSPRDPRRSIEWRRLRHRWTRCRPTVPAPRASRWPTRQAVCVLRERARRTAQPHAPLPPGVRVGEAAPVSREPRRPK